jgi:hypothetical protein
MHQYMLLLYADEQGGLALPREEMAAWMEKMHAYSAALEKAGAFVSTGGLGITRNARTVHVKNGEMQVHDGPFAETREQLGGYYMINAESMEAAEKWGAQCPGALWGHIEIRQVMHG